MWRIALIVVGLPAYAENGPPPEPPEPPAVDEPQAEREDRDHCDGATLVIARMHLCEVEHPRGYEPITDDTVYTKGGE